MQETQGHPWFRPVTVQVHGIAPFTGSCAGPALLILFVRRPQTPDEHVEIGTDRLRLVLETTEEVLGRIEAVSPAERAEVSPEWLARLRASTADDPWTHGFSMVDRDDGRVIGSCGYKGPPGADGVVEIAYGVDPAHRGRGYATEAARALVAFAFGSGSVRLVLAHTLPESNASTAVLRKCGFTWVGEVVDPENGLVWRWNKDAEVA
jgi:[ribosomal protein S5]-alanine N-acetyltransferase